MEILIVFILGFGLVIYYINAFRVLNKTIWVNVLLLQFFVVHFLVLSFFYFALKEKRKEGDSRHRKFAAYGFFTFLAAIILAIGYVFYDRRMYF